MPFYSNLNNQISTHIAFASKPKSGPVMNTSRDNYLLLRFWWCMTLSRARLTWRSNLYALAVAALTLGSYHHYSLSHRHESCSLANSTFLRLSSRIWFGSFATSTGCCSRVSNGLSFTIFYFLSSIHRLFKVNINIDW